VCRMIELQRRLAQDYQKQREFELSRQMAHVGIQDRAPTDQIMLDPHVDVERFGSGSPQLYQPSSPGHQPADHVRTMAQFAGRDHRPPRSVILDHQVATSWPQSDIAGVRQYGDMHDGRQPDHIRPMPVGKHVTNGSASEDDFVQQLKSRSAK